MEAATILTRGALAGTAAPTGTEAQTQADWADIQARLTRLDAEIIRRQAEGTTAREVLAKLQATVPLARQREADLSALAAQGFVSTHAGQDRMRERVELERDLATQHARVDEANAALAETRQTRMAYLAETRRGLNDRLTKAWLDLAQLQQQSAKTARREQITLLRSPVAGTVQQLAVRSTGGVVTPAQALLVVVPENAAITAEVMVENKDIGFIRVGQPAAVKVEAFDFTRYGTVPATVHSVSADAINDEKRGAVFLVELRLQPKEESTNEPPALAAGMNISGEIAIGRRTVASFIANPIRAAAQQSLRER
jgi:hemolysin D